LLRLTKPKSRAGLVYWVSTTAIQDLRIARDVE